MKNIMWAMDELELLKSNYVSASNDELLNMLPRRTLDGIKIKAGKMGLHRVPPWTEEEDKIIYEMLPTATDRQLEYALPNRTLSAIKQRGGDLCVSRPRKHYRADDAFHYFFDDIDTSQKAYVLGFFVGDGSLTWNDEKSLYVTRFASDDKEILDKIRDVIGCNVNVRETGRSDECVLNIGSKQLTGALKNMGYNGNKSHEAFLPIIPAHLYSHFARGLFDADGCIKRVKDGKKYYPVVDFNGTEQLLNQLDKVLPEHVNVAYTGDVYRLTFRYRKARSVLDWMYQDAGSLYLDRKYQRYLDSQTQTGFYQ